MNTEQYYELLFVDLAFMKTLKSAKKIAVKKVAQSWVVESNQIR